MNDVLRIARLKIALQRAFLGQAILIFTCYCFLYIMSHMTGSPCGSRESLVCHRDVVARIAGVKVRLHCNNGGFTRRCSMGLKKKTHLWITKKWFNPFNIHNQESKKLAILKTLHFQSCSQYE